MNFGEQASQIISSLKVSANLFLHRYSWEVPAPIAFVIRALEDIALFRVIALAELAYLEGYHVVALAII